MIHIVDYGLGNVQAFLTMYKRLGYETTRAQQSSDLIGAKKIILPGVGSFDHAIKLLNESGMQSTLDTLVLDKKIPVLGVCVGMQILASRSDEGILNGLGWIPGSVNAFNDNVNPTDFPLPHMGWNEVQSCAGHPLFLGLEKNAKFYFLHSYHFECEVYSNNVASAYYGMKFCCAVSSGNVYGVQFHPEKSHSFGAQLLKNFAEL
jgi:imidazole glycerol-phosphate synthase subunit HisH